MLIPLLSRFIPGHTIESFPEEVKAIRDAGHDMSVVLNELYGFWLNLLEAVYTAIHMSMDHSFLVLLVIGSSPTADT